MLLESKLVPWVCILENGIIIFMHSIVGKVKFHRYAKIPLTEISSCLCLSVSTTAVHSSCVFSVAYIKFGDHMITWHILSGAMNSSSLSGQNAPWPTHSHIHKRTLSL